MLCNRLGSITLLLLALVLKGCGIPMQTPILEAPRYVSENENENYGDLKFFFEHSDSQPSGFLGYDIYYKWYHPNNLATFDTDMEELLDSPLNRTRLQSKNYVRFRAEEANMLQQPSIQIRSEQYFATAGEAETITVSIFPTIITDEPTRQIDLFRFYDGEHHSITQPIEVSIEDDQIIVPDNDFNSAIKSYIRNSIAQEPNVQRIDLKLGIVVAAYGLSVQMTELYSPIVYPQTRDTLFDVTLQIEITN